MLKDIIPAEWRKYVYALVTLAAGVFSAWQAAEGNWEPFAGGVITFLTTSLATANTDGKLIGERGEEGNVDPGSAALGLVLGGLIVWVLLR